MLLTKIFISVFFIHVSFALYPQLCPNQTQFSSWNETRCPIGWSCAPNGFSSTGWGCSPFRDAVICNDYQSCPAGSQCVPQSSTGWLEVFTCMDTTPAARPNSTSVCSCKPGVPLPFDSVRKNVIIVGDSLTIGYTPVVAELLADIALVQHVPWDVLDGGAEETAYGLQCIDLWLASPSGMPIQPDLIYFNFGMHDTATSGQGCPGQWGNTSVYPGELRQIAEKILTFSKNSMHSVKVMFALTTPMMCDAAQDKVISATLNTAARGIMSSLGISTIDLHQPIIDLCGPAPNMNCLGQSQCFCPHCPGVGYQLLANATIAPAIRAELSKTNS